MAADVHDLATDGKDVQVGVQTRRELVVYELATQQCPHVGAAPAARDMALVCLGQAGDHVEPLLHEILDVPRARGSPRAGALGPHVPLVLDRVEADVHHPLCTQA